MVISSNGCGPCAAGAPWAMQADSARVFVPGHALIQNLRNGFFTLTERLPRAMRLLTVWPVLAHAI